MAERFLTNHRHISLSMTPQGRQALGTNLINLSAFDKIVYNRNHDNYDLSKKDRSVYTIEENHVSEDDWRTLALIFE